MNAFRIKTVDGYDISTVINRPESRDIIIWMHGISVNKDEYLGFFHEGAKRLGDRGIGSIRFDFRGHGDSSGNSLDFSIVGQNLDVRAIVDFAQHNFARGTRLHIVGASFGAPPAIFAAARYPIRSICLIAPVLSYRRTFIEPETEWGREIFSIDRLQKLDKTGRLYIESEFCVSHRFVEEMRIIRPDTVLADLKQRILIMHGNRDSMVPYDATAQICEGLQHVTLLTLEGADHGFMQEGDDEGVSPNSLSNKETIYRMIEENILCIPNKAF